MKESETFDASGQNFSTKLQKITHESRDLTNQSAADSDIYFILRAPRFLNPDDRGVLQVLIEKKGIID